MKKMVIICTFFLILTNLISSGQKQDSISLNVTPNPFDSITTFSFYISSADTVTIEIYNLWGQKVAVIYYKKYFIQGNHDTICNLNFLPNEVYLSRLIVGGNSMGMKIVKNTGNKIIQEGTNNQNQISIYPNPAFDKVFILTHDDKPDRIELFSITGQLLKTKPLRESIKQSIDLTEIQVDVLILKIISKDAQVIKTSIVIRQK